MICFWNGKSNESRIVNDTEKPDTNFKYHSF